MKLLFTIRYEYGRYDYFDNGTYTSFNLLGNQISSPTAWKYRGGEVQYWDGVHNDNYWIRDLERVQEAYANYLAKLVLEEP